MLRWKRHRGLPVHRVPGGGLPRVFAYTDELDAWLANRGTDPNGAAEEAAEPLPALASPGRLVAAAALGALVAITATITWTSRGAVTPPQRFVILGNQLAALDPSGATRWTHSFTVSPLTSTPALWTQIADIDHDSQAEVLASIELVQHASDRHAGQLLRFSADGHLRWAVSPADRIRFREGQYAAPWTAGEPIIYRTARDTRIAWPVHHFTWWPGILLTLNAEGRRIGTFVNSGWIGNVAASTDGRYLLVTGISNARGSYFFGVLDAEHPDGHSPEPPGSPYECLDCPSGAPVTYYVFPRTDVGQHHAFPQASPAPRVVDDRAIDVHVLESGGPDIATVIYELGSDFAVRAARFSDSFWELHRSLERDGMLDHRADACPHRRVLDVQRWTAAEGWRTLRVSVR